MVVKLKYLFFMIQYSNHKEILELQYVTGFE